MARLKVKRHNIDFADLALDQSTTHYIGRKDGCDIVLQADPGISRQHMVLQYKNNSWSVKVLSQHLPMNSEGKSFSQLELHPSDSFLIPPYEFIFEDEASASRDVESSHPLVDLSENIDALIEQEGSDIFNQAIPDGHQIINHKKEEAINPEVTFHGNEEQTSDIHLEGEPYLKFVFQTHSESIRLKGNKWIAGRDSIAQIQLDDRKASRQHFSLEKVGEQYFIKDLKSANGTLLNGQELIADEAKEIKSGDIITVNQLTVIFELRDLSFSDKLKDLPLQAYSGPMILTSQDWDVVGPTVEPVLQQPPPLPTPQLAQISGTVQKIEAPPQKNVLRMALMGVVALGVMYFALFGTEEAPKQEVTDPLVRTFESLKPEDKKLVVDDYNLVLQYTENGQIENALSRLEKIHSLVNFYKDSKELQARNIEARELLKHKEFILQQEREQLATKQKILTIVTDCRERYASGVDAAAAKSCLSEALQLDPDNTEAQSIISGIELRLSQAEEQERRLKEYNESVEKGRELFAKAKNYLQGKDYHEAINAFSAHVNSNLPDPDNLKKASSRTIANIQGQISTQKNRFMNKAKGFVEAGNLRDAILEAEKAKTIDPYDYSIPNFIESHRRELEGQMKLLYQESAIEEKFGNLNKSEEKWKVIIEKDVPSGEYYLKAKRKMQQYGRL